MFLFIGKDFFMRNNSIITDRKDRRIAHRANRDVSCPRTTRLALTCTCNVYVRHNSFRVIHYKRPRRFQLISVSAASNATTVLNNENSDSPKLHEPFTINCPINPSANYVICQTARRYLSIKTWEKFKLIMFLESLFLPSLRVLMDSNGNKYIKIDVLIKLNN